MTTAALSSKVIRREVKAPQNCEPSARRRRSSKPSRPPLAPELRDHRRALAGVGVDPVRGAGEQLGQRDAEQLGERRAREDHLGGLEVGDEQRHRVRLGEGAEALLARLEALLDRLLLR